MADNFGKHRALEGYLTVEASLVIPVALIVIMLTIYFGFFCFDQCVSMQNAYLVCLRASNQWEAGGTEKEEMAKSEWNRLTESLFISMNNKQLDIKASGRKVTAEFSASIANVYAEKFEIGPDRLKVCAKTEANTVYPARIVRERQKAGNTE